MAVDPNGDAGGLLQFGVVSVDYATCGEDFRATWEPLQYASDFLCGFDGCDAGDWGLGTGKFLKLES